MFGSKTKEEKIAQARAEIEMLVSDFLEGEGKLPEGFSDRYRAGIYIMRTPFEDYLRKIRSGVDSLNDRSGVSDWIYLDGTLGVNEAATVIADWVKKQREMHEIIRNKCHIGNTTMFMPLSTRCDGGVIVVTDESRRDDPVSEETLRICREMNISFCVILSENTLYDLIEQREMEIVYETYPNYHDETYADWSFRYL